MSKSKKPTENTGEIGKPVTDKIPVDIFKANATKLKYLQVLKNLKLVNDLLRLLASPNDHKVLLIS